MVDIKTVSPLQAWLQTVLPTVYDDSLTYLEFLGKVADKLNELIASDAAQAAALVEFQALINELISGGTTTLHNHDSRYYTEAETNILLGAKANSDDVYGKTDVYTKTELNAGQLDTRYYTETEANALLNAKADKTQEAWITPTLLNGATGTLKYMKDQMGFVHFKGTVGVSNTQVTFVVMPTGYRPAEINYFSAPRSDSLTTIQKVAIFSVGSMWASATGTLYLDSLTYRAEA